MLLARLRYKLLAVVGVAVASGLIGTSMFYTHTAEEVIVSQHRRTLHKITEAVNMGVESMMLEGHAELASEYARRLRNVPDAKDFRILRVDGTEAFRDNLTIRNVNAKLGQDAFQPREKEEVIPVLPATLPAFQQVLAGAEAVLYYGRDEIDQRVVHFLDPIFMQASCKRCHEDGTLVRGVIKVTTSMAPVERDILQAREESLAVLGFTLVATVAFMGYMLGRTVVRPIEVVTHAMARVSGGDLDHHVPVSTRDELGHMATSFNAMTEDLRNTYDGLKREQDKLTTIIQGAREAIVVTDAQGSIALVNPAAEQMLEKSAARIAADGFGRLFDDPQVMARLLGDGSGTKGELISYRNRSLLVSASSILDGNGGPIGSAALIRDVTDEKRLEAELLRLSTTDGLTGLFNRRHLDETLRKELSRAGHTRSPLSVVMFDVDHFKRFNDEHGHDQGDRVLQEVAQQLRKVLRRYDSPCRYGGEEFLAILPGADVDGALQVAERLRQGVEAAEVDGLSVTISLGVATYPKIPAEDPARLIEAADEALYRSKQAGRNRVSLARGEGPPLAVAR